MIIAGSADFGRKHTVRGCNQTVPRLVWDWTDRRTLTVQGDLREIWDNLSVILFEFSFRYSVVRGTERLGDRLTDLRSPCPNLPEPSTDNQPLFSCIYYTTSGNDRALAGFRAGIVTDSPARI